MKALTPLTHPHILQSWTQWRTSEKSCISWCDATKHHHRLMLKYGRRPQWHQAAPYTTLSHKYDTRRMSKWFKSSNRWICSCITSISWRIFNLNISLNAWCAVYFMQFTFHPWVCQINGSFKSPSHYVILFQPGHTTHSENILHDENMNQSQ